MKAEHVSIALRHEDIPHIGDKVACLLRETGIEKPLDLKGMDALWLYNKICKITLQNHGPQLLDRLLAAINFAEGGAPRPLSAFTATRKQLLTGRPGNSIRLDQT